MLFAASLATSTIILLSVPFAAAQIVVNSTGDKPNAFPLLTGVCSTDLIERGECTLRAAIQLANFNPDLTTITFNIPTSDSGYDPQTGSYTINVGSPLPQLNTDLSIDGPGASVLTVQRDPSGLASGIFSITTASTVNIAGIRIKDGSLPGGSGAGIANFNDAIVNVNSCIFLGNTANGSGGGFANYSTGNVTLTNCVFTQNAADQGGGGIANLSTGKVTVTDCTIEANIGGGLFNSNGIFTVNHTSISANITGGAGGGVFNKFGTFNLTDSTVSQNSANGGGGGGVFNREGSLVISNSRIFSNTCASPPSQGGNGGGVESAAGSLMVNNCTISDNSVMAGNDTGVGGAGTAFGGGIFANGSLTLRGTTVANNTAAGGSATSLFGAPGSAIGGGLFSAAESVVTNCTFSGNSARPGASHIPRGTADGGGIYFDSTGHNFTLNNSTVTGNSAVSITVIGQDTANSGGLVNKSGNFILKSSLVASNSGGSAPDVSGTFVSQDYNLIGAVDGSSGFNVSTDHTGTAAAPLDPKIDPAGLRNNGGPTETVATLRTSIAINNGAPDSPSTDQRGVARVNAPDIGAFEFNGNFFPATLQNISTRGLVGIGDEVMIGGFIISGTGDKNVLLRAKGPSLSNPPVSLTGTLQDPTLSLFRGSTRIEFNDNWAQAANAGSIPPGLQPSNPLESAILISLAPGAYTAIVSGLNGGTGIGLVEVFDLDATVPSKLSNISTRELVETGDNVLIGGFIVKGPDSEPVVIRAIGPSLANPPINLTNVLQNPNLGLFNDQGSRIQFNDDWQSDQANDIIATGLQPSNPAESAIVRALTPGNYTAIVTGVNNTTGIALVEVYERN
jgi:CSLREA domain-containing protein